MLKHDFTSAWCKSSTHPGTHSIPSTLSTPVSLVLPKPYEYGDQLKPVFSHGFWLIMLLLLYHKRIGVISQCWLNYKSILLLWRQFKNMFDLTNTKKFEDLEEIFSLLQKSWRGKCRKSCTISMPSSVTVAYVKIISQGADFLAPPLLPILVVRGQRLSSLEM